MEERQFADIVKSTKHTVLSAIRKYLAVRFYHAVDDVAQETYIRAYKGLIKDKFSGKSSINTWLYTIAKNESLRMNEKLKKEEAKFQKAADKMNENFAIESTMNSKDMGIIEKIDLKRLMTELPEKYRSVLELSALGYTERQIAEQLEIKRGTVKSRTSRGRELMQRIAKGGVYNG